MKVTSCHYLSIFVCCALFQLVCVVAYRVLESHTVLACRTRPVLEKEGFRFQYSVGTTQTTPLSVYSIRSGGGICMNSCFLTCLCFLRSPYGACIP